MSEIVSLQKTRRSPAASGLKFAEAIDADASVMPLRAAGWPLLSKDDIYRAIFLLDLAAQHARLLVKQIVEPSRRQNFAAKIDAIERLIQIARHLASKL
ncbi:MAG: hypothetical protein V4517_05610 [Pseudomonadota bacterium]